MKNRHGMRLMERLGVSGAILLAGVATCLCQDASPSLGLASVSFDSSSASELGAQVKELRTAVADMKDQLQRMQSETAKLRAELHETQSQLAVLDRSAAISPASSPQTPANSTAWPADPIGNMTSQNQDGDPVSKLKEDQQLLEAKVNDQYQTKVESASKYRIRLSGMALLNVFSNRGSAENNEVPTWAVSRSPGDPNGSFGATVRQSTIGLEVFGPKLAGANTHGEIQMDFFGSVPNVSNGITAGQVRMKIATVRMDWKDTSIVAGQDALFFSPLSPTSYASFAEPAFAYSGNLWAWTPQIRVEHQIHLSESSGLLLQGGILEPLTGEPPSNPVYVSPQAGEKGGQPAYATRLAWTQTAFGRPLTVGVGGYYSRQNWGFARQVNGWAGTADWNFPLGRRLTFSGEFYRGNAIGGLGGALGRSVIYNGLLSSATTSVTGLNTLGGWGQIGFRLTGRLELNGAFGDDNPFARDFSIQGQSYFSSYITRNRGAFANVIYRPRSNLILSLEYRRIWTYGIYNPASIRASQINLATGVLF